MITLEKFFRALEKVKVEGRWSMGLIIADLKAVDFGLLKSAKEKIIVDGALLPAAVIKKIIKAFAEGEWVVLEIKGTLPAEVYNQLKLLSTQNRIQLPDGEVARQPESARIVAVAEPETVKSIEIEYPDFKYLFGPIINL